MATSIGFDIVAVAGGVAVLVVRCLEVAVINKKCLGLEISASRVPSVVQMGCAMVVVMFHMV